MKADRDLVLDALEDAQRILAEYVEPGWGRNPSRTINRLLSLLDREDLAAAQERLRAGYGLRVVK
ncbi:MAG: hypothetical protein NVSMB6_24720 [Burkholderiaceae bacterium]